MKIRINNQIDIFEDFSLERYNTFRIHCKAKYFTKISNTEQLAWLLTKSEYRDLNKLYLGGGSNILLVNNFDGIVIKIEIAGINILKEDSKHVILSVGAGVEWHTLVTYCVNNHFHGIENLAFIPGNVGSAPIQNIGAYGMELKDSMEYLEAIDIETGNIEIFRNQECKFNYRDSIFKNELKNKYVITKVIFKLKKESNLNLSYSELQEELADLKNNVRIKDIYDAVIEIRRRKLPNPDIMGNAGSFFKNPIISFSKFEKLHAKHPDFNGYIGSDGLIKISAARLVEMAGYKGKIVDNVATYQHHALIIVNYSNATGKEIYNFSTDIVKAVKHEFDIELEPEVNIIK